MGTAVPFCLAIRAPSGVTWPPASSNAAVHVRPSGGLLLGGRGRQMASLRQNLSATDSKLVAGTQRMLVMFGALPGSSKTRV